ncbi:hypothetical protein [Oceanobacillus sp. CAU 1775]
MRKLLLLLLTGLLSVTLLAACGNDAEETTTDENQDSETEVTDDIEPEDTQEEDEEESNEEVEGGRTRTGSNTMNSSFKVTEEAQTDLRLGDTALVQTSIGTYELTVHTAEMVGTELDGEEALLDEIILLEMTFKNVGDLPIIAEDVMINLGIRTDLEGSDNTNAAASFDSIEFFEGRIAPGEEREAQFIADTRTADEYYFGSSSGSVASGGHNEIRFTILDEETRDE